MLIIFDLDDTLVDTSGSITRPNLKHMLAYLDQEGLSFGPIDSGYEMLMRLDMWTKTTQRTLDEFLEIHDIPETLGRRALDWMNVSDVASTTAVPGALALIEELFLEHELVLVTIGDRDRQLAKLRQAQIPFHLFKKIIACNDKKIIYKELLDEFSYSPDQIVVIGDRIHRDLAPGKELGFKTIHIKWGRGVNCMDVRGEVDHTVWRLSDCKKILNLIKNF